MSYARKVRKKSKSRIIVGITILLLMPLSFLLYMNITYADKIYGGVSVGKVSLGGLTKNEAMELLSREYESRIQNNDIDVVFGNKSHSIRIKENAKPDFSSTVDEAFRTGRKEAFFEKLIISFGNKRSLPITAEYNLQSIKDIISDFAGSIEEEKNIITFSEDKTKVRIDLVEGIVADVDSTVKAVTDNFSSLEIKDVRLITKTIDDDILETLYQKLNRESSDATFEVIDNEVVINEGKTGTKVPKEEISTRIESGSKVFELDVEIIEPEISKNYLESLIFRDILSSYTTRFALTNPGRTKNITLSANAINNTVIAPGKNFSFNDVVGQRTYANGYADANVYVGGKIEQGVGGGICQVSSTLYTTQLLADLETVTRYNHMFTVSYLPLGQDATVSWNSLDYVFKNNTKYPIRIKTSVSNGVHNIQILGTKSDPNRTVKIVTETISTTPVKERIEYSNNLKPDETVVLQSGQTGAVVDTYKVYYYNGVEEKRQFLHRSTYQVMDRIIQKGPTKVSVEEEEVPVETQNPDENQTNESPKPSKTPKPTKKPQSTPEVSPEKNPIPDEYLSENGI